MKQNILFPLVMEGRTGYIDANGKVILQPQYCLARSFSEGLAQVKIGKKWGYIDENGEWSVTLQDFDSAGKFAEGLAVVTINDKHGYNKYGYIDKSGKLVIQPEFDDARDFSGISRAKKRRRSPQTSKTIYTLSGNFSGDRFESLCLLLTGNLL